ncbi:Uncharacterised protein [uncultured archaeon]|nr:Uncharacterised protein [uncultured archaeon]
MRMDNLGDVVRRCRDEVLFDFPDANIIFFYGSFSYRDLDAPLKQGDIADLRSPYGRKPDFIVVVPDLDKAVGRLGEKYDWSSRQRGKILDQDRDTPFYFNVETFHKHELCDESVFLRYKMGVIGEDGFSRACSMRNGNIYLSSRLSKFVNVLHCHDDVVSVLDGIRNYFVDLALRLVPARFSGEEFVRAYLQSTYLAEAHRFFDLVRHKHMNILESHVYDWNAGRIAPMRSELEKMLSGRILSRAERVSGSDFYDSVFVNKESARRGSVLRDFLFFNLCACRAVLKNRITNSACNGSNLGYVLRKIWK